MTAITFNTGRGYTDKGQRIAAERLPDGSVVFYDLDRGIWGNFGPDVVYPFTPLQVLIEYDKGTYGYVSTEDVGHLRNLLIERDPPIPSYPLTY